jgi:hypothetical protein
MHIRARTTAAPFYLTRSLAGQSTTRAQNAKPSPPSSDKASFRPRTQGSPSTKIRATKCETPRPEAHSLKPPPRKSSRAARTRRIRRTRRKSHFLRRLANRRTRRTPKALDTLAWLPALNRPRRVVYAAYVRTSLVCEVYLSATPRRARRTLRRARRNLSVFDRPPPLERPRRNSFSMANAPESPDDTNL